MRLTLKTSAQSFVNDLANEVSVEVPMARSLETLAMSIMRSEPMPHDMAQMLADHLKTNLEPGDGIAGIRISCIKSHDNPSINNTRLIIRSDMEDVQYGNIARFMQGEHPGLTLSNIIGFTRFNNIPDMTGMIFLQKAPEGDHMAAALRSYLTSLVTKHRGYRLEEMANGETRAVPFDPVHEVKEMNVPHAYKTMQNILHRDRAIPMPAGDQFKSAVISRGAQELGIYLPPDISEQDMIFGVTDCLREVMMEMNGTTTIEGFGGQDMSMSIAHIMLIDAYISAQCRKYPDIPLSTIDDVCDLSRTTPLLDAAQAVTSTLENGRFAPSFGRPPAPQPNVTPVASRNNGPQM